MRTASVNPARSTRRGRLRFLRRSSGPADGRRAAGPHRVVVRPRPGPGYYVSLWSGLLLDEPGILVWSNSAGERYPPVHRLGIILVRPRHPIAPQVLEQGASVQPVRLARVLRPGEFSVIPGTQAVRIDGYPVHREMQRIAAQAVQLDGDQARLGMQLGQGSPDSA